MKFSKKLQQLKIHNLHRTKALILFEIWLPGTPFSDGHDFNLNYRTVNASDFQRAMGQSRRQRDNRRASEHMFFHLLAEIENHLHPKIIRIVRIATIPYQKLLECDTGYPLKTAS